MQLNYSMGNTCKTNLAFKFARDDQTTPKHCHYFSLTYGSKRRRKKKKEKGSFFWMHWINYSAGSKLHFIGFIHLISQSVFNRHCKNNNLNWFGSTKSYLPEKKKKKIPSKYNLKELFGFFFFFFYLTFDNFYNTAFYGTRSSLKPSWRGIVSLCIWLRNHSPAPRS